MVMAIVIAMVIAMVILCIDACHDCIESLRGTRGVDLPRQLVFTCFLLLLQSRGARLESLPGMSGAGHFLGMDA